MYLTKCPCSPHCFKIIRNTIVVKSVVISAIGITGIVIFPAKGMGTRNYHALKQVSWILCTNSATTIIITCITIELCCSASSNWLCRLLETHLRK